MILPVRSIKGKNHLGKHGKLMQKLITHFWTWLLILSHHWMKSLSHLLLSYRYHLKCSLFRIFCCNMFAALWTRLTSGQWVTKAKYLYHHLVHLAGKKVDDEWTPMWMTIPELPHSCQLLSKCPCKGAFTRFKCSKVNLPCTPLCRCNCTK